MPATICGGRGAIGPRLNIGTRFGAETELRKLENMGHSNRGPLSFKAVGEESEAIMRRATKKTSTGMSWRTSQGMMVHQIVFGSIFALSSNPMFGAFASDSNCFD
jgi:hypothetical protein